MPIIPAHYKLKSDETNPTDKQPQRTNIIEETKTYTEGKHAESE